MGIFRHVLRRLGRSPMFTVTSVLTLAIGIGANTSIFSVVNGVILKPLPYRDADRLVGVWHKAPGLNLPQLNASPATYFTYREEGKTFEDIGLWRRESASVTGISEPEQVRCSRGYRRNTADSRRSSASREVVHKAGRFSRECRNGYAVVRLLAATIRK